MRCLSPVLILAALAAIGGQAAAQVEEYPWKAADEEFGRAGRAAALDLLKGLTGPDIERLRAYLADAPVQPELRKLLVPAQERVLARDHRAVLALLGSVELGDRTLLEARLWRLRAHAHEQLGALPEALSAWRTCDAISGRLGWLAGQDEALRRQAALLDALSEFDGAAKAYDRRVEVLRRRGRKREELAARLDSAACRVEAGRVREGSKDLALAIEAAAAGGWAELEAAGRQSLAIAHWKRAEFAEALDEAERAMALATHSPTDAARAGNAMLQGVILMDLGDFAAAERHYQRAASLLAEGDALNRALVRGNLGVLAWRQGRGREAIDLLEAAQLEFGRLRDDARVAEACRNLADVLMESGRPSDAAPLLMRAYELSGRDPLARAAALAGLADVQLRLRRNDRARALLAKARAIDDGERDRRTRYRLLEIEARLLRDEGDRQGAIDALRTALDTVEDTVAGLSDEQTYAVRAQRDRLFQLAVATAFENGTADPDAVAEFIERSRASVLREALGGRRAEDAAAAPGTLASQLAEARQEVVEARLRHLVALRAAERERVDASRASLDAAEEDLRVLSGRAERKLRGLSRPAPAPAATLPELRAALRPDEALVYYALHGAQAHALVVTRTEPATAVALGESARIRALCGAADAALRESDATIPVRELRELLIGRLPRSARVPRVIVCPDGPLSFLPWPVLLGDRYASNVPSGSALALMRRRGAHPGGAIIAFGAPDYSGAVVAAARGDGRDALPGLLLHARREAQEIGALSENARAVTGAQATEAAARAALAPDARWGVVHFACHGVVDHRFPRRSALALTPAGDDDGFLTVPEILSLRTRADLVVLSACDSGTGAFVRGEGVIGLARAFLAAGAPRVVASLWRVDDAATHKLMVSFHRHRAGGADCARALRAAQEEVRAVDAWSKPRYWAAWVIWGVP